MRVNPGVDTGEVMKITKSCMYPLAKVEFGLNPVTLAVVRKIRIRVLPVLAVSGMLMLIFTPGASDVAMWVMEYLP